jgi:hypothetical protein
MIRPIFLNKAGVVAVSSGVSLYVTPSVSQLKVTEQGAYQIGLEAYYYLYPHRFCAGYGRAILSSAVL